MDADNLCKTKVRNIHSIRLLTESNLLVESWSGGGLLGKDLLGVLENAELLLESFFSLYTKMRVSTNLLLPKYVLECQSCLFLGSLIQISLQL